jgi:GT2 family glycosyltransferase
MCAPRLSIVLATHDRAKVLTHTLERLAALALDPHEVETIVVDNASRDDVGAVVRSYPGARLLRLARNAGSCAKTFGVDVARAPVVLFLDDDSYPRPGSIQRMLARFVDQPRLGAAGFIVHLPGGGQECSALPHVFVGCGVGLRTAAMRAVGGLDTSFFMQAEEYDLSFRLLQAGWKVEICGDLAVEHLKSPQARRCQRAAYLDVVNNLRVLARYLPQPHYAIYRADWQARYRRLAQVRRHHAAFHRGRWVGRWRGRLERPRYRRWRLAPPVLERIFTWSYIESRMAGLKSAGVRRVVFADWGKNIYAFYRAARQVGVEVLAVADDLYAAATAGGMLSAAWYRDVPLTSVSAALTLPADAWVISNTSYVHAAQRAPRLARRVTVPVHNWFLPPAAPGPQPGRLGVESMVSC